MKKDKFIKTFMIDGVKVKVEAEQRRMDEPRMTRSRIYMFPKNESMMENLKKRYNRPVKFWKKIAENVLDTFLYHDKRMIFSQNAGCTCGCSPGFICKANSYHEFFITYSIEKR